MRQLTNWTLLLGLFPPLLAQDKPPALAVGNLQIAGVLRVRIEDWDWFSAPSTNSRYTYGSALLRLSLGQSWKRIEWQADGAFPLFLNLPANSVAPPPAGPLGYGGDYYSVEHARYLGAAVLRQAILVVRNDQWRLKLGRFEFADGGETTPPDPFLATLKRERIDQRLIARFTYATRSFDGAEFTWSSGANTIEAMGARVVEGSFLLRDLAEIDTEVGYGSFTSHSQSGKFPAEWSVFALFYQDGRGAVKVDNRPPEGIQSDHRPIRLITPGAHYIRAFKMRPGTADLVFWGAGQFGAWGVQRQIAAAGTLEAGFEFAAPWKPWIQAGYLYTTGDHDPNDNLHETFLPILTTPRAFAPYPFYIATNANDAFVQFRFNPLKSLTLRSALHSVRLSSARDLWYDGGGPFEQSTFGYIGRPGGGSKAVGTAFEFRADCNLGGNRSASLYAGLGRGNGVPEEAFPSGGKNPLTHTISVEFAQRF